MSSRENSAGEFRRKSLDIGPNFVESFRDRYYCSGENQIQHL